MPLLAWLGLVVLAGLAICLLVRAVSYHRTPAELRGDWWTPFEREFRAYARGATGSPHRPGRRRGQQRPAR